MVVREVVGRERELAAAEPFLEAVQSGVSALVLAGDAGIGKTSVWSAVVERAAAKGCRVLACQAEQVEAQLSFVGLADLVGECADEVLPSLPALQRQALQAALLRETPLGSGADGRTVAVAFRSLLVELARSGPLVVAVDDVQWLDPPSARVLAFAARRLDGQRVGLVATVRTPSSSADPLGLDRALGAGLATVRLGPLSFGALRSILDTRLGGGISRPLLMRIVELSGGNPLFALEIARELCAAPAVDLAGPLPVGESLRELLAGYIPTLSASAREALLAAAALSRPTAGLVERASSTTGLAEAEETGLVRVDHDRVVFAHPLYASAVYTTAATSRRRRLHRQLAALVADPEEQARHLALAATEPDEGVARRLDEAAALARSRGAWESAAELLEQARRLTPAGGLDDGLRRGITAAEHLVHAGDRGRARTLLEQLLSQPLSRSLRADTLRLLAEISHNDENFAEAERLYTEALAHASEPGLTVTIELGLAYVRANMLDYSGGAEHARRALCQAKAIGDDALVAEALAYHTMLEHVCGRGLDWDKVEQSLALEDPDRVVPAQTRPSALAGFLLLWEGRLSEARARLMKLRARMIERGDESDLAFILWWLVYLETQSGDFAAAARFAEEAAVLAELTGARSSLAWVSAMRAFLRAHTGDVDGARRDYAEAMGLAKRTRWAASAPWIAAAGVRLELSLDDPAAAWQTVAPLIEPVEESWSSGTALAPFLPDALEALIALGEFDRAQALLDPLERSVGERSALATLRRPRGLLLAGRGDLDAAAKALDEALVEHERLEVPFELARTLLVQGQIRRRRREKRAARETLERSLELFERLGAPLWADKARAEIARLGLRQAPGELTETEQRVATSAASGMTNRAIAAALFISPKTVQANLARVYAKLGVRTRAELGARMAHHHETQAELPPEGAKSPTDS